MKKPPLIQRLASWLARIRWTFPSGCMSTRCRLNDGRTAREAADLATRAEIRCHFVQIQVAEAIAVVGKEHLLACDVLADRPQPLADVAPDSSVDHGNTPVLLRIAEDLDVVAETRDDAISVAAACSSRRIP